MNFGVLWCTLMYFDVLWCPLVYFWGVLWCTTMDYGVLLRCTSVYYNELRCTSVYNSVLQSNLAKFSTSFGYYSRLWCPVRSLHWQVLAVGFILLLSLLVGLVFILFLYFYLVAVLFVLCIFFLSYSPSVTFDIQSGFAICVFCYHVFPLPLRIARFSVACSYSCV